MPNTPTFSSKRLAAHIARQDRDVLIAAYVRRLEAELFPHQESEEEQEAFTPEGRKRAAEVLAMFHDEVQRRAQERKP